MQTSTSARRNDSMAIFVIYGLLLLIAWAGVHQLDRPTDRASAQNYIIQTATPPLPTPAIAPAIAPALVLSAPTPAPDRALPASTVDPGDSAGATVDPGDAAAPDPAAYLAIVGQQAPHSPRGDVPPPPPDYVSGPILYPDQNVIIVPAESLDSPAVIGPAVAVPPISAQQAAVIGARTSNTCAPGEMFYPRTGCHAPGSGGPQPGPIGAP